VRHKPSKNPDVYILGSTDISEELKTLKDSSKRSIVQLTEKPSQELLKKLAKESNTNHLLLECGPRLLSSFLNAGLIDELIVYQAPFIIGEGQGMADGYSISSMNNRLDWDVFSIDRIKDDIKIVYIRKENSDYVNYTSTV
jgi:diaminohydroxyphosphoribosylaminopyrimidine deaminase/5-amino-6-(5-phosphoribosylamino)uracil reductase